MTTINAPPSAEQIPSKARLAVGGTIFVLGQLSPLSIPLVAAANLSAGWKTTLTGLLLIGSQPSNRLT